MQIESTILGAHLDSQRAVLTLLDDDGNVQELIISPTGLVLPDECLLEWRFNDVEVPAR